MLTPRRAVVRVFIDVHWHGSASVFASVREIGQDCGGCGRNKQAKYLMANGKISLMASDIHRILRHVRPCFDAYASLPKLSFQRSSSKYSHQGTGTGKA